MERSLTRSNRAPMHLATLILTLVTIFVLDISLPLGVAAGVPYVAVVLLAHSLPWRHSVPVVAAVSSALTILGYFLSAPAGDAWMVLINRAVALFAIWITAILLARRMKAEEALEEAHVNLESVVAERTTSLRESEARLRGIMDNVVDGIITIDERGIIDNVNRAASLMFGYSAELICGQNVSALMPEPYRSEHDGYLANYRRTGRGRVMGVGPREVVGLRKDGSTFPLEVELSVMDTDGKRRYIGIVHDITQRKEAQKQAQQAQKMEAIGHLSGGIAHDFNNLLTTMFGNLHFLKKRIEGDPKAEKFLEAALKTAHRGADLTQRLLNFSSKQLLRPEVTIVNEFVRGVVELLERTLGAHIEIETVLADDVWPVKVDVSQLENSLLNLVINARDAMPEGGKLTIETTNIGPDKEDADAREEAAPGQFVTVAVSDTGTGMPPEIVDQVFEPFFTTKNASKGSGLGLSTVNGFVKQCGGYIEVDSKVGRGTTIKLCLPRATTGVDRAARVAEILGDNQPSGDETIFVVEDDLDARRFAVTALRMLGYQVMEAEDGPAALAMLGEVPHIDLVLVDVALPRGMDGLQVADELRKRRPEVKILFTSAYAQNASVNNDRPDDGAKLLAKPYTRKILARKVRTLLDNSGK